MGSAVIVGWFEDELRRRCLARALHPGRRLHGRRGRDADGDARHRGLAAGISIQEVFVRELVTGAITGTLIGVVFFPFALVVWDDAAVAGSVALALGVGCSIATWSRWRCRTRSPVRPRSAYGSGPLATVIRDLLSVIVYFAIATALIWPPPASRKLVRPKR